MVTLNLTPKQDLAARLKMGWRASHEQIPWKTTVQKDAMTSTRQEEAALFTSCSHQLQRAGTSVLIITF